MNRHEPEAGLVGFRSVRRLDRYAWLGAWHADRRAVLHGHVEAFIPSGGGQIVPLGQMNAIMQPGGPSGGGVVLKPRASRAA